MGPHLTTHRLTITPKGHDPRVENVLQNARDLGLEGLRGVEIADIYFLSGTLNQADRDGIQWILVDPLLQTGSWDRCISSKGNHVVESMLHPGVTDPVATELQRLAGTAGIEVVAATGKRFALIGEIERRDVDRLASSVLANPIIEQWSIDSFAGPIHNPNSDAQRPLAGQIDLSSATTDEDLIALNVERGLALVTV